MNCDWKQSQANSKIRDSRNRACDWCIASCLEDFGRIWKALCPHSEVRPQWHREGVSPSQEALLNTWLAARTVCSCANCYLQPSLSIWWSVLQILCCCWLVIEICTNWSCGDLRLFTIIRVKMQKGHCSSIETAGQRSRFSLYKCVKIHQPSVQKRHCKFVLWDNSTAKYETQEIIFWGEVHFVVILKSSSTIPKKVSVGLS